MHYNTETSKRLIQMNPSCSQSTFRDSARHALQAQKHQDGTVRINTPFQELQTQKMANLKQKLTQLNMSSSVRCQSNLHNNSSQASVTAATSYRVRGGGNSGAMDKSGQQIRPNSNISNLLDSRPNFDRSKTFITDLTRFSQNSVSKDLSPLRVSNLNASGPNQHKMLTQSGNNNSSKRRNEAQIQSRKSLRCEQTVKRSRNSASSKRAGIGVNTGSQQQQMSKFSNGKRTTLCRSASFPRANSVQSMRTNQSSPERLVNIVCPPSKGEKKRKNGQRILQNDSSNKQARPRSDMRHSLYSNQFIATDKSYKKDSKDKSYLQKQLRALGNQYGLSGPQSSSTQSQFMSTKRLGMQLSKKVMQTPTKQKSRSHSRLDLCKSANKCSTPSMSMKKQSLKKLNQRVNKLSKADQRKLGECRKQISRNCSIRSKSAQSMDRSSNSNFNQRSENQNNRDDRRAEKYLRNQRNNSNLKEQFNFASIEAQNTIDLSFNEPQAHGRPPSGQVTGKFRSLNEPMLSQMIAQRQRENNNSRTDKHGNQQTALQAAAAGQKSTLKTEDDYCDTLTDTASSEDSPIRPSQRVQRAAALTTKAYLEEVNYRVENAKNHALSIREFGPRKMKAAYKQINERQGTRLQNLKQQMQESLVETHVLQAKLQNSSNIDEKHGARRKGVSQFNSLVLEFSQNLENKASELIEATESKRKNAKMREMIAEMQETRKLVRSGSQSAPTSARRQQRSSLPLSNQKSARKHHKLGRSRSRSSIKTDRSGQSDRSSRSRKSSARKSNASKRARKRSKSQRSAKRQGSARSKSKSKSVTRAKSVRSRRSLSKSARSGRSATSIVSSRGRSHSRKKIKSVKRNIFKQTNGFRDIGQTIQNIKSRPLRSKSRRSKSKSTKSRSKSIKNHHQQGKKQQSSISGKRLSRVKELAQKCDRLMDRKFRGLDRSQKQKSKASLSKIKQAKRASKSRSKSKRKLSMGKQQKVKSKSRSKSARKLRKSSARNNKSPLIMKKPQDHQDVTPNVTPKITPQVTPCMTPLHKILRNSMGDPEMSEMVARSGQMGGGRFGSMANQNKKVKICSRRLQDITQLTSSDSDSSSDSEDSLDNERYLKRQQAHLSPWQRACIRKQLPKKFR